MLALLLAENGNFPTFTLNPCARACASVSPTLPMPGSVYVQPGIRLRLIGFAGLPAMCATATIPCMLATCASCGVQGMVAVAHMADGVNTGFARPLVFVYLDELAVQLNL